MLGGFINPLIVFLCVICFMTGCVSHKNSDTKKAQKEESPISDTIIRMQEMRYRMETSRPSWEEDVPSQEIFGGFASDIPDPIYDQYAEPRAPINERNVITPPPFTGKGASQQAENIAQPEPESAPERSQPTARTILTPQPDNSDYGSSAADYNLYWSGEVSLED